MLHATLEALLGLFYGFEALYPQDKSTPEEKSRAKAKKWLRIGHRVLCLGKAVVLIALALAATIADAH